MRAQFILSEIGIGLRRNLTMTVAVIVTVAISLGLFGTGLLIRQQVDTMKDYWYDRVEVAVFLCAQGAREPSCAGGEVTQDQRQQIEADLKALPQVSKVYYESKQEAYQHFKEQFKDSAIFDTVRPESMPESFRVKLKDPEQFQVVRSAFEGRPGVQDVQDQKQVLDKFFKVLNGFQLAALIVALVQIAAAALLISNTIRVAAFSRRRETGIMRLVGASNFYIQLPFILEGAIAGLIGAGFASIALVALQKFVVQDRLVRNFPFTKFVGWEAVWSTVPVILLTGVLLAGLASFITLRRYLRV
jgi:cell division transport system permease protein